MRSSSDDFHARFDRATGRFLALGSAVLVIGLLIELARVG
jgi:hypothetical protein